MPIMKHTENIAVIDVGSNTLRLLIGNVDKNQVIKIYSERVVTRLGRNLDKNGFFDSESLKKSINTLRKFKKISEKFNVSSIIAVGTSALRESKNSKEFCEIVRKTTGINIHVISGQQEAYYTLCGVMDEKFSSKDSIFIVDIGGGSTEWIYGIKGKFSMGSLSLGALKLKENFLFIEPYSQEAIYEAKKFIENEIIKAIPKVKVDEFIAIGGTASTLAMINMNLSKYCPEKTHMSKISLNKLKEILKKLISISLEDIKKIKGIPYDRADIICSGLLILEKIVDYLNIKEITISENGILEGIMKKSKDFCYNGLL
ncbi:MAG: hypothetical protein NZ845_01045 [Thermodesulfovibrio sp.]|nr:hypothetical protein [Thermodesulfovibrio sp.]